MQQNTLRGKKRFDKTLASGGHQTGKRWTAARQQDGKGKDGIGGK